MARRADHTRDELTSLAIKAGLELIKKEGFSNFSARKVATKIGYTIGTIYHIFGSHEAFILHLNAHTLDEWYEFMQTAIKRDKNKHPIKAMARAYVHYSRMHHEQWVALFEHHIQGDVPAWYQAKFTRFFDLVEALLLPIVNNDAKKAKHETHVLWAGIHGICVLSLSGKFELVSAHSAETLAMSFIDSYLNGLHR